MSAVIADDTKEPSPKPSSRSKWLRIAALAALTVALIGIAKWTGVAEELTRDRIQAMMLDLGALGFFAFLAVFAIGELMHVPGMVFVAAAILAYGPGLGFAAGMAGAIVSVTVSFFVVRLVGGQPLGEIERPFLRRMIAHLDERPMRTVTVLRLIFAMLPALNYGLAMSKVRFRDYIAGSAVGLVPWIAAMALAFDWIAANLTFLFGH